MSSGRYKTCAVPLCTNTQVKTPRKLFMFVPRAIELRKKWLSLAHRDPDKISNKSAIYFCEDHFNLPEDMENYIEYSVMGKVKKVLLKPNCLPSKFACQPRGHKWTSKQQRAAKKGRGIVQETEDILNYCEMAAHDTGSQVGAVTKSEVPVTSESDTFEPLIIHIKSEQQPATRPTEELHEQIIVKQELTEVKQEHLVVKPEPVSSPELSEREAELSEASETDKRAEDNNSKSVMDALLRKQSFKILSLTSRCRRHKLLVNKYRARLRTKEKLIDALQSQLTALSALTGTAQLQLPPAHNGVSKKRGRRRTTRQKRTPVSTVSTLAPPVSTTISAVSTPTPPKSAPTPPKSAPTPPKSAPTPPKSTPTPPKWTPTPPKSTPTPPVSTVSDTRTNTLVIQIDGQHATVKPPKLVRLSTTAT